MPFHLIDYSFTSNILLQDIARHFNPLRLYLPWHMEPPAYVSENPGVVCSYPPEYLMPRKEFKKMLGGCIERMKQNHDRSYMEIHKSGGLNALNEESEWRIRSLLMGKHASGTDSMDENSEKHHLILHLAEEMDSLLCDADRILNRLKNFPPLMGKSVESASDNKSLLEDLNGFSRESWLNDSHLDRIFDAWSALFGALIPNNEILVTSSLSIFERLMEHYDGLYPLRKAVSFLLPRLPLKNKSEPTNERQENTGTIVENIMRMIFLSAKDPETGIREIGRISGESNAIFSKRYSNHLLNCAISHLSQPEDEGKNQPWLNFFNNRTVLLVRQV